MKCATLRCSGSLSGWNCHGIGNIADNLQLGSGAAQAMGEAGSGDAGVRAGSLQWEARKEPGRQLPAAVILAGGRGPEAFPHLQDIGPQPLARSACLVGARLCFLGIPWYCLFLASLWCLRHRVPIFCSTDTMHH